ncbi:MAG: hypothetical protein WC882_01535 [Candidatus Gracilibacteria bacterium]
MSFEELKELAKQNLPWEVIWFLIIIIGSFIIKIPQAICIAWKILRHNRASLGGGSGERRADVFTHLWHSKYLRNKEIQQHDILINSSGKSMKNLTFGSIAQNSLNKLKLTENSNDNVIVIKNIRNRLVYYFCLVWLVLFCGDTMSYYKNIKISNKMG